MTETPILELPLVQPSQAQKHVTVNEALVRLDGLAQLTLQSRSVTTPPAVVEGACYAVPASATGDWTGEDGKIAIGSNGGWVTVTPKMGWRAFVVDESVDVLWSGSDWALATLAQTPNGGGALFRTIEVDCPLSTDAVQALSAVVPSHAMLFAASARVIGEITGTLTAWKLGTASSDAQFGSGMGTAAGSYSSGILGSPTTFYASTPLQFSAIGGTVTGGQLRIAISYMEFTIPAI